MGSPPLRHATAPPPPSRDRCRRSPSPLSHQCRHSSSPENSHWRESHCPTARSTLCRVPLMKQRRARKNDPFVGVVRLHSVGASGLQRRIDGGYQRGESLRAHVYHRGGVRGRLRLGCLRLCPERGPWAAAAWWRAWRRLSRSLRTPGGQAGAVSPRSAFAGSKNTAPSARFT